MSIRRSGHRGQSSPGQNRVFKSPNQLSPRMLWGEQRLAEITSQTPDVERSNRTSELLVVPSSTRTWASGSHDFDSTGVLEGVLDPGSGILSGDLLVATVFGATYQPQTPTLDDIPGWTTLAKDGVNSGAFTGAGHAWMIAVKAAGAGDIDNTATYALAMNRPGTKELNDFIEWRVTAVPLGGGTAQTGSVVTASGHAGSNSSTVYTAPTLSSSTAHYGLVVGMSGCSSSAGSRHSQVSIDSPATEVSSSGADKAEGAVGHVQVGDAAKITAAFSGVGDYGRIAGAVCVVPIAP